MQPVEISRETIGKPVSSDNIIVVNASIDGGDARMSRYKVEGNVKYRLEQVPILSEELFDLTLRADIAVYEYGKGKNQFTVTNTTEQRVTLTRRASASVEQRYFLRGGPNSLSLILSFEVTVSGVTLKTIAIE